MKSVARYIVLIAFFSGSLTGLAQVITENNDLVYGYDPLLYNGKMYAFYCEPGTTGTQFLCDDFDKHGEITLRGVTYAELMLNYDLYNQKVVLKYRNPIGSTNLIDISEAWMTTFNLAGKHFELIANSDTSRRIYQVLGNGPGKILYFSHKQYLIDTRVQSRSHYFSDIEREMYLQYANKQLRYKNNRSFVACFSKENQESVKKYLHKERIKVKKANDIRITELINYCNTLTGL